MRHESLVDRVERIVPLLADGDFNFFLEKVKKVPWKLQGLFIGRYAKTLETKSRFDANQWALEADRFSEYKFGVAFDDEKLHELAEEMANDCMVLIDRRYTVESYAVGRGYCERHGVDAPTVDWDSETYQRLMIGAINRMKCRKWWLRRLRIHHKRAHESIARDWGIVKKQKEIYCSNNALYTRQQQKKRNASLLESMLAVCEETGEAIKLSEIAEHALSNPAIRRNELMVRIRGMDEYSQVRGHAAGLYTITCPSKYHAVLSKSGAQNPKYKGFNPREGQQYLSSVWARIRASLKRQGIDIYGMRVAEPQHDGTPHWHLLLFLHPDQQKALVNTFSRYALAEDGGESGAKKHRFDVEFIDRKKGSAVGYIAKYISKNIDGFGVDFDLYGKDAKASAARVEAWASTWGIRQFQFIGGPPVTVWRELRRLESIPAGLSGNLRATWLSTGVRGMSEPDWCEFMQQMEKSDLTLYWLKNEGVKVELNEYGEPRAAKVFGLNVGGKLLPTRVLTWKIEKVSALGAPWTCVNNCTDAIDIPAMLEDVGAKINELSPDEIAGFTEKMERLENHERSRRQNSDSERLH